MSRVDMRIALVHSYYDDRLPSGENVVVDNQAAALERAGYSVAVMGLRTKDTRNEPLYIVRSALRVATGWGRKPSGLKEFQPDVVHVHNLFPNLARRWVASLDVPFVATLHNYRPLCANAHLLREGAVCTRCPDGRPFSGLRFACYRGSRLATLPLTIATLPSADSDPVLGRASRLLVMSDLMADVYARSGIERSRMVVMPNFLPDELTPAWSAGEPGRQGWLFVGRLSPEKGIVELVEDWPLGHSLSVVGDGPLRARVERAGANKDIRVLGSLQRAEVVQLMRRSMGLVFPSRWFEGSPLVYAEALACGLPVLAWEPNVLASAVGTDGTGLRIAGRDTLRTALPAAEEEFPTLRSRCRSVFESRYSEAAFVRRLENVYRRVIEESRSD